MISASEHSPLFRAWYEDAFTLIVSEPLLAELETVVARPGIQRFAHPVRAKRFIALLREQAVMVIPAANTPTCRDPKDDMIIATAIAARASFIVTSDKDLLDDEKLQQALAGYNLRVVYPLEFLKLIT
jgi:putative PIN family toxin of toxin-antitoxin system